MSNLVDFPIKEVEVYKSLTNLFGCDKFISFYYTDSGELAYCWGGDLSVEETVYLQSVFNSFASGEILKRMRDQKK